MTTYEVVEGRLLAMGEDTGIAVQVYDNGMRTVFRRRGKGLASYSGVWHDTAVMRFIQTTLGDKRISLIIGRFG